MKGRSEFIITGSGTTQEEVSKDTRYLVQSFVDGYDVCILAYGQIGSGKTLTGYGSDRYRDLTPRAARDGKGTLFWGSSLRGAKYQEFLRALASEEQHTTYKNLKLTMPIGGSLKGNAETLMSVNIPQLESDLDKIWQPLLFWITDCSVVSLHLSECDFEGNDQEWLRSLNDEAERKTLSQLTEDKFEEMIENFENEPAKVSAGWCFNDPLVDSLIVFMENWNPISNAGKEEMVLPGKKVRPMLSNVPQTSDHCMCNGIEDSVSDSIYRCKSCGIYVHGQQNSDQMDQLKISDWPCTKHGVLSGAYVCIYCEVGCNNGNAIKPTTNPAKWDHEVYALYTN
ncbi:hypothetical protein SUGI_0791390 [Cryptomeria japonica]|nr:hypothetical protein SUGI_0791390 [Cryptomeria japonica]